MLSGAAPNLVYTPNSNFNGNDSFGFVANDGLVDSNISLISITVNAENDAPVADSQNVSTNEESILPITLSASDADGDSLTYSILTQPANGVLTGTAPNLNYTPNADFNGADTFTYLVNDGTVDSAIATASITVVAVNDVPVANAQIITTNEDAAVSIILAGSDTDSDTLTYQVVTQPAQGLLSGISPSFTYTPNANANGNDQFTFVANDGFIDSAPATVSITVAATNDAPVATVQTITTNEDTAANIVLSGSDIDGDALTYSVATQPLNGVLTGAEPNITYLPNADYNGVDSFSFIVNDGLINSAAATILINIAAANDAPVAIAQNVSIDEDTASIISLNANDIDGDTITYQVVSQPLQGTLTGAAPNLTYTPNENYSGIDSFTFKANDALVDSVIKTVSINIAAVNDLAVANNLTITSDEDSSVAITLTGSDVETDTLTYRLVTQPAKGVLSGIAPNLTYTANANYNGADSFTYVVNDGTADSIAATV